MLKPKKKKKVNSGNPVIDKAIIASNKRKAAAKKKAKLGPTKGGAKTITKKNRLSYLTKAADSQVKAKKQGNQNKRDKKTVQAAKIDRIVNGFNKSLGLDVTDKAMSKRLKAALEAEVRLKKNKKKKTR